VANLLGARGSSRKSGKQTALFCRTAPGLERGICAQRQELEMGACCGSRSSNSMCFPGFVPWLICAGNSPGNLEIMPCSYCRSYVRLGGGTKLCQLSLVGGQDV